MRSTFLISVCLFLSLVKFSTAEELCPGSDKLPPPSGASELKIYEKDFTVDRAMKAISFLETDVIKIIKEHKGPHSILDYEGFYIGYPNNVTFVKGTLLKQEVLIAKNKLEIEKLKLRISTTTKEEVSKAEKGYLAAKKNFCDFLKQAEYVD